MAGTWWMDKSHSAVVSMYVNSEMLLWWPDFLYFRPTKGSSTLERTLYSTVPGTVALIALPKGTCRQRLEHKEPPYQALRSTLVNLRMSADTSINSSHLID